MVCFFVENFDRRSVFLLPSVFRKVEPSVDPSLPTQSRRSPFTLFRGTSGLVPRVTVLGSGPGRPRDLERDRPLEVGNVQEQVSRPGDGWSAEVWVPDLLPPLKP